MPHEPGQPLFNVERAVIPEGKLAGYSLNPDHDRGGNKAKVWESALGVTPAHAREIEKQVFAWLPYLPVFAWLPYLPAEFQASGSTHGSRFKVTIPITGPNGKTVDVTSAWIYDRIDDPDDVSLDPEAEKKGERKKSIGVKSIPQLTRHS